MSTLLERPADLFDRVREWMELSVFVSDRTDGVVRQRRTVYRIAERVGELLIGAPIIRVGATVVSDKDDCSAHELDIVALCPGRGSRHRVIEAIGEVKLRKLDVVS